MKKFLLILLMLILAFSLIACSVDGPDTDTSTDNQPTDSNTNKELTENTFVVNKIYDRYFDKITPAPAYLLDDMEEIRGSYKIIKTHEEYATCVDKTDGVNAELFNDNCILIVKSSTTDFHAVKLDNVLTEKTVVVDVQSTLEAVPAYIIDPNADSQRLLYNIFLVIPKNYVPENIDLLGRLTFEISSFKGYSFEAEGIQNLNSENLKKNDAFVFDNANEYLSFLQQISGDDFYSIMDNNSYVLAFYYDIKDSSTIKIFKSFSIDGSNVYLTLDIYDAISSEANEDNVFFVKIPKENVEEVNLPENPIFHITINQYYD